MQWFELKCYKKGLRRPTVPKSSDGSGRKAMEMKQISTNMHIKETCIINTIHLKAIRNYFLLGYLLLLLLCIVLIHLFAVGFFCQVIFFFWCVLAIGISRNGMKNLTFANCKELCNEMICGKTVLLPFDWRAIA